MDPFIFGMACGAILTNIIWGSLYGREVRRRKQLERGRSAH